jgi:hypothetical protein
MNRPAEGVRLAKNAPYRTLSPVLEVIAAAFETLAAHADLAGRLSDV